MRKMLKLENLANKQKSTAYNGRFGAMAAVARRQFCEKFNVITPQEVQWKPPLRQAAGTLGATRTDEQQLLNYKI